MKHTAEVSLDNLLLYTHDHQVWAAQSRPDIDRKGYAMDILFIGTASVIQKPIVTLRAVLSTRM